MEMTLYDDNLNRAGSNESMSLKRPISLNLDSTENATKKQRFATILTSPDLQMLKLASPELERFIISNGNFSLTPTPSQFLLPAKNVTEEQEQYARGFLDALNQLHESQFLTGIRTGTTPVAINAPADNQNGFPKQLYNGMQQFYLQSSPTSVIKSLGNAKPTPQPAPSIKQTLVVRPPSADNNTSNSCNSMSSTSTTMPLEIAIKEEQSLPDYSNYSSPPLSPIISKDPIDMAEQEKLKLERKRYRNRLAASKCRKRKLEKISQLEDKVKELKGENCKLENVVSELRDQVCLLKQEVLRHHKRGCQIMMTHNI